MEIRLEVFSLVPGHSQGSYSVILAESNGNRKLPVMIGGYEAQAIAIELEKIKPTRPLTHDLFANTLRAYGISIERIRIVRLSEGIFYANLVCINNEHQQMEIDSRTSDAIALAVRFEAPIYVASEIMDEAAFEPEDEETEEAGPETDVPAAPKTWAEDLKSMSTAELESALDEALREEDYYKAAGIRDEINRRKD
jgi:bifunctional DNase/RNase